MTLTTNPELKQIWLTALRSGEYTQTKHALKTLGEEGGYCCLGVLCEVSKTGHWVEANTSCCYVVEGETPLAALPPRTVLPALFKDSHKAHIKDLLNPSAFIERASQLLQQCDQYTDRHLEDIQDPNTPLVLALSILNDLGISFATIADLVEDFF